MRNENIIEKEVMNHDGNQRDEVIQIYDSLDERRKRLLWVHIRALAGKNMGC